MDNRKGVGRTKEVNGFGLLELRVIMVSTGWNNVGTGKGNTGHILKVRRKSQYKLIANNCGDQPGVWNSLKLWFLKFKFIKQKYYWGSAVNMENLCKIIIFQFGSFFNRLSKSLWMLRGIRWTFQGFVTSLKCHQSSVYTTEPLMSLCERSLSWWLGYFSPDSFLPQGTAVSSNLIFLDNWTPLSLAVFISLILSK